MFIDAQKQVPPASPHRTATTNTSSADLFWPLLVRAFGTVLMFLPLSMATLGPIPKKDVAAATAQVITTFTALSGSSLPKQRW